MRAFRDLDTRNGERILLEEGRFTDSAGVKFVAFAAYKDCRRVPGLSVVREDRLKAATGYKPLSRSERKALLPRDGDGTSWQFCPHCGKALK